MGHPIAEGPISSCSCALGSEARSLIPHPDWEVMRSCLLTASRETGRVGDAWEQLLSVPLVLVPDQLQLSHASV